MEIDKHIKDLSPWCGIGRPAEWSAMCNIVSNNLTVTAALIDNELNPIVIIDNGNGKLEVIGNIIRYISLLHMYNNNMINGNVTCKLIDLEQIMDKNKICVSKPQFIKCSLSAEMFGMDRGSISSELIRFVAQKLDINKLGILQCTDKEASRSNPSAAKAKVIKWLDYHGDRSVDDLVSKEFITEYRGKIGNTVFGPWKKKNVKKKGETNKKKKIKQNMAVSNKILNNKSIDNLENTEEHDQEVLNLS